MTQAYTESERLWFRAPQPSDVPFLAGALQDPRVRRNLLIGRYPFNEEAETAWMARHAQPPVMDGKTDVHFTFGLKGGDQPLGGTGLHRISMIHRHAEWGVFIGRPEEWGKGYGREVAGAMLRYAFNTLNLHRVYLRANADNELGLKAYTAAGFAHEGAMRQHHFVDGAWVDVVYMGVLRVNWKAAA